MNYEFRWQNKIFYLLFLLAILVTVFIFSLASQGDIQVKRLEELPQDTAIAVYFNYNQASGADYTEPYRQITRPGDNLEQIIIEAIDSAQSTIDVAVQEFRLPNLARALAQRQQAGVKVRVILENQYSRPWSEFTPEEVAEMDTRNRARYQDFFAFADQNNDGKLSPQEINSREALVILQNANIPMIDDTADGSQGSGLMHHKFVVIDSQVVIVTSANFTASDIHGDFTQLSTRGNANNLLKITNSEVANLFSQEFNLMWGDGPGGQLDSKFGVNKPFRNAQVLTFGQTTITIKFSPSSQTLPWQDTSNGLIGYTLARAVDSADLALFVFSEQKLADILELRHQQGVNVRALIDPEFAFRNYSEGLDMLGVALSNQCQYEKENNPWQNPINTVGVPKLHSGDKLHHKFAIVNEETVIAGSHNWSAAANNQNDETLLVISNPTVTSHYQREFERLYSDAKLGLPVTIQKKIEEDSQKCGLLDANTDIDAPADTADKSEQLIDLNTASQEELETLPGIGEKIAARIIEERKKEPFTSLDDLQRVAGIGQAKIKKLSGKVTW